MPNGNASNIPCQKFFGGLPLVAIVGFGVYIADIWVAYRKEARAVCVLSKPRMPTCRIRKPLILKSPSLVGQIAGLSVVFELLSNAVSKIPVEMLQKPLIQTLGGKPIALLALDMNSPVAGNPILVGSMAPPVAVQQARRRAKIRFVKYIRLGALITVFTMAIGILMLTVQVKTAGGLQTASGEPERPMRATVMPAASSASKTFKIVLLCDDVDKRSKGLQGFRGLKKDEAALFVFEVPKAVTFWMGSVRYPIDIVFIGPDQRVVRTYLDCQPGSRKYFRSLQKISWVLETAAGAGIRVGDAIRIEGLRGLGHGSEGGRAKKLSNGETSE